MMQLTSTEIDIIKRLQDGANAKQLLRERELYRKWNYPATEAEIAAIAQKAKASGEWLRIFNEQANSKKRLKGAL